MPERTPSISAVLPAYNEAAVIEQTVRRTHAALARTDAPAWEIVVVDDGSNDGTGEVVRSLAGELTHVRPVSHPRNRGYGEALRTGFEASRHEAVFLMDSDGQFDPLDLRILLLHYTPRTLVAGDRAHRSDSLLRRAYNRSFFMLVWMLFGPTVRDVNCAFKLFPRPLGQRLTCGGAMISTELVLRARRLGYGIIDVPVPHYPRTAGSPTGARPRVVLRAFAELWRLRRDPHSLRDPVAVIPLEEPAGR